MLDEDAVPPGAVSDDVYCRCRYSGEKCNFYLRAVLAFEMLTWQLAFEICSWISSAITVNYKIKVRRVITAGLCTTLSVRQIQSASTPSSLPPPC